MERTGRFSRRQRSLAFGTGLSLAFALVLLVVQSLTASNGGANLGIRKSVDRAAVTKSQSIKYTLVVSNSGISTAQNVAITDTLPLSVTYNGSFQKADHNAIENSSGVSNGIVTWSGAIGPQGFVTLTFGATVTDSVAGGVGITNTAYVTGSGTLLSDSATTTVVTKTTFYLPVMFQPVPVPVLTGISRSTSNNQWNVNWTDVSIPPLTGYELQEDSDLGFASPSTYPMGMALTRSFTKPEDTNNVYCYRVRAMTSTLIGAWSNARCVYGNYRDDFNDDNSGWAMRREDTDDVDNETYYRNGKFTMKIHGRWDSMIAGPLTPVPASWSSYRIETRVKLADGVDYLQGYGIVFGGDWNGVDPCPDNKKFTSCFNHFYRVNVIWVGGDVLQTNLKRIDSHDNKTGKDESKGLMDWKDLKVSNASGWNDWAVEVHSDGRIRLYLNGKLIEEVNDTKYITGETYFGGFATSNEYLGTAARYEYYRVSLIP